MNAVDLVVVLSSFIFPFVFSFSFLLFSGIGSIRI